MINPANTNLGTSSLERIMRLHTFNLAVRRLSVARYCEWVAAGRPGLAAKDAVQVAAFGDSKMDILAGYLADHSFERFLIGREP